MQQLQLDHPGYLLRQHVVHATISCRFVNEIFEQYHKSFKYVLIERAHIMHGTHILRIRNVTT